MKLRIQDRIFDIILIFAAVLTIVVFIGLFTLIVDNAWPGIVHNGLHFFTSDIWNPSKNSFGAGGIFFGTIAASLIALIIAVPTAILSAVCIRLFLQGKLRFYCARFIELLAAIPSIIYGMWGLFVLVPVLQQVIKPLLQVVSTKIPYFSGFEGFSILAGGIVLSIMIYPIITTGIYDIIGRVPSGIFESSYAVGSTRFETIRKIILPYIQPSLIGSIVVGFGRALGETMGVTFIIGNTTLLQSIFKPGSSVASVLAVEFDESLSSLHRSSMMELALVLIIISLIAFTLTKWMASVQSKKFKSG